MPAAVATAFCPLTPPLKPGPVQVYVKAEGPPFKLTVVVLQLTEPPEDAVGLGGVVLLPTEATAVFVQPLVPVTVNV